MNLQIVGAISSSINIPDGYVFNYGRLIAVNRTRTRDPIINRIVYDPNRSLNVWKKYLIRALIAGTIKFYRRGSEYILTEDKKDFRKKQNNDNLNYFDFNINWDIFTPSRFDCELILTIAELDHGIRGRIREIRVPLIGFLMHELDDLIQGEIDRININISVSDTQLEVIAWRITDPIESGDADDITVIDDEEMLGNAIIYHSVVGTPPNVPIITDHCVYDGILYMYKPTIRKLTKEKLLYIFGKNDYMEGVTTNDVKKFCIEYKILLRVIDIRGELCVEYTPERYTNKHKVLVYLYSSNHMQLITDRKKRDRVTNQLRTKCSYANKSPKRNFNVDSVEKHKKIILQDVVINDLQKIKEIHAEKDLVIILYNTICLRQTFLDIINKFNVAYKNTCINDKMTEIIYNEENPHILLKATDQPEIAFYLDDCNETTDNCLNVSKLNHETYTKYNTEEVEIKSELNAITYSIFSNMNNIIQRKFSEATEDAVCFDINKCHSSAIAYIEEDFPVYTVLDYPQPFGYKMQKKVPVGFYYVNEVPEEFPLLSVGWKSSVELNSYDIRRLNITQQLLPSRLIPKNHFTDYIHDIYDKFGKFSKNIANVFIGGLGKTKSKYSTIDVSRDQSDVLRTKYKHKENSIHNCLSKEGDVWVNNNRSIYDLFYTSSPIYHFIVGNANKSANKLYNRLKNEKTELVYCKTDAICIKGGYNKIETTKEGLGTIKEDIVDYNFGKYIKEPKNVNVLLMDHAIEEITEEMYMDKYLGKSLLITGLAGCGKTYLTKKIIAELEKMNKKIIRLAPTNKASNIIEGTTISSYFSLFLNNKKPSNMFKLIHKIDYLVVDEISMNTREFWFIFHYAKHIKNSIKYILIGDINQLPPVEDFYFINDPNYVENGMSNLVDYRINLTENKRSGNELLTEISKKILENKFEPDFVETYNTTRNIVYTNRRRKQLNYEIAIDIYRGAEQKLNINFENLDEKSQYQNLYICIGTPVIACKTKKHLKFANSEFFEVAEINKKEEVIVIKNSEEKETKIISLTFKEFKESFLMNYATTVYKCQGDTFDVPFTIHEWVKMNKNMRYTAFSRTTNVNNVSIVRN